MIPRQLGDIARITGGRLDNADATTPVTAAVVVDSRRVAAGGLFVCVRGEHVDGHDFATQAVQAGAVAVLADRPTGTPAVVVTDIEAALAALARDAYAEVAPLVVGVTGSSGKTSTKDLMAAVFGAAGETVAPEASYNTEVGMPLTVLRMTPTTQTLVLEYSARGPGHIRYLCGIVAPQIAAVLNVGAAHLGEFGSRAAIAAAKGELVEALPTNGVAVLNADDEHVSAMRSRTAARAVTFGTQPAADFRIDAVDVDELARPSFRLHTPDDGTLDLRLGLHGRHQAMNAAAVVATAFAAGLPLTLAAEAVQAASSVSPHRMQLRRRHDGLIVIDDAYNANPDSMHAALAALRRVAAGGRRAWAVFGPMRELGDESDMMHAEIGRAAAEAGIGELVTVGADAKLYADAAQATPGWSGRARGLADVNEAAALLVAEARADDVVLVKASNSERLWRVAEAIVDDTTAGDPADDGARA